MAENHDDKCGCKVLTERIPRTNGGTREVWQFCPAHEAEYKLEHDGALADYQAGQADKARRRATREEFA